MSVTTPESMPDEHATLLRAADLVVGFGSTRVAGPISFTLARGEVLAICGPNAVGKTTLLRTLAGLLPPLGGTVHLRAEDGVVDPARCHPVRRAAHLSFLPQRSDVAAPFRVERAVALGRTFLPRDAGAIDRALDDVELADLRTRSVQELSAGQVQRTGLARVLAQLDGGGALLLDEPTSALDPRHATALGRVLRRRCTAAAEPGERRLGVALAIHDLVLAARLADRVLLLGEDGASWLGTVAEVFEPAMLERVYGVPFELVGGDGAETSVPLVRAAPRP